MSRNDWNSLRIGDEIVYVDCSGQAESAIIQSDLWRDENGSYILLTRRTQSPVYILCIETLTFTFNHINYWKRWLNA